MNYFYTPHKTELNKNAGYKITKKLYTLEGKLITNNQLLLNHQYIVKIQIQTSIPSQQQIEIIDPLYGGVQILSESHNSVISSSPYFYQIGQVHLFTSLKNKKPKELQYIIESQTAGIWHAPKIFVYNPNNSEIFGYSSQHPITIIP